jgi:hypothetical protein
LTYVAPVPLDYDALQSGLAAVLSVACNIPGSSVGAITNAEQAFYFPDCDPADGATLAKITYDITGIKPMGSDEWRVGYDPTVMIPGDTYQPNPAQPSQRLGAAIYSSEGNRQITVSIKCECWDLSGAGAIKFIERIRARMGMPSFVLALRALSCAQCRTSNTRCMSYISDDGRSVDVAQFDLILNAADAAVDDPITTIEKLGKPTFTPVT